MRLHKVVEAKNFRTLAKDLLIHKQVAVPIYSSSDSWGNEVAKRIQSIYLEDAEKNGTPPMSASFDGTDEIMNQLTGLPSLTPRKMYKFTLTDVQNKSLIHHAQLTRFKEEEEL